MSASLILPSSSFGLFGMQVQHQTSTHAGNILSSYGNPCKLSTPVQVYATCMCLPKRKAKKHGLCRKNLPRLLKTIWHRKAVWKTLFQNKHSGTINPYVSTPKLLNNTKNVSINKTLSITNLAQYFYPATLEEHPINNYDPDRVLLGNHAMERKCINSYTGLGEASSRTHSRTKS